MELSKMPVFAGLTDAELKAFTGGCQETVIPAGERLVTQEQSLQRLFFVYEGKLRVWISARRREHELAEVSAPTVIGEIELFCGGVGPANVTAVTESRALVISHTAYKQRLDSSDVATLKVTRNFARVLAYRLSATDRRIAEILAKDAPANQELAGLRQKLFGEWSV